METATTNLVDFERYSKAFSETRGCSDTIALLDSDSILKNWGSIEPLLNRVLTRLDTGFTLDDVLTALQWQRMQCWQVNDWDAVAVTQFTDLPQYRLFSILFVGGQGIDRWLSALVENLSAYGKAGGAKYLDFYGRDGWRKPAKALGFNKQYTIMQKEL